MIIKHMSIIRELYSSGDSLVVEANSLGSKRVALKFHTDLKLGKIKWLFIYITVRYQRKGHFGAIGRKISLYEVAKLV